VPEAAPVSPSHGRNIWRKIGAGLRFGAGHRLLRPIAITPAVSNLFGSVFGAMYALYLVKELGMAPVHLGALQVVRYPVFRFAGRGAMSAGALLGDVLGELPGVCTTLAIGVIGMLATPVWLALSPVAKVRSRPLHREGK
jgi:hypothetical protein